MKYFYREKSYHKQYNQEELCFKGSFHFIQKKKKNNGKQTAHLEGNYFKVMITVCQHYLPQDMVSH